VFNTSANPKVVIGVDGWLFRDTENHLLKYQYSDYCDNSIPNRVESIAHTVLKKGIDFIFVMPQTKDFVYPDKTYYGNFDGHYVYPTMYITQELHRRGICSLDLTQAVKDAREQTGREMWLSLDGHWNDEGSWYGYLKLYVFLNECGIVSGELPDVDFVSAKAYRADLLGQIYGVYCILGDEIMLLRSIVNPKAKRIANGEVWDNLQQLKDKYGWRDFGPNNAPVVYYKNDSLSGGKRVLLLMDSLFADLSSNVGNGSVAPLLAENVPELVGIWYAYNPDQIEALIKAYNPEVIIFERTIQ
jgi:hypothetical protein